MTPQPKRAPAFPVVLLSSCPPSPKSSTSAWTTTVRPTMLFAPLNEINESVMLILATPLASASTLPKSPTWRFWAVGAPCSLPDGLKCGPAEVQPFVLSPNWWTWKPCCPGANPLISPLTLTGPFSLSYWRKENFEKISYFYFVGTAFHNKKNSSWVINIFKFFSATD